MAISMQNNLIVNSASVSDRGLSEKRPQNEDSYIEMPQCGIYAVADGVGGAQAGEVASQMAMELLGEAFANIPPGTDAETLLRSAIGQANSAIYQMANELPQLANMATTIVALHIDGDIATIGHVGDSRLYRVDQNGDLFRETDDHSMVADEIRAGRMTEEQAENHPSRNIISRALGAEATVEPDLKTMMIAPGTAFLLCSDGITRHVTDAEIKGVLTFGGDAADVCDYLKGLCFERGAEDNLTAVVIRAGYAGEAISDIAKDDILDLEETTITSARSPFDDKVLSDNSDSLLELDAADPDDVATGSLMPNLAEPIDDEPAVTLSPIPGELIETTPDSDQMAMAPTEAFTMFGEVSGPPETSQANSLPSILAAVGMLVVGAVIGLGVYHFALAPKPVEVPSPQLSEMKSENIPMTSFEKARRTVDVDPAAYVKEVAPALDAIDFYLMGRAQLLTGDFNTARYSLLEAEKRLPQVDPTNAKVLEHDIAIALAIANDPAGQQRLIGEIAAAQKAASNPNPANVNR
ncbi:MAG: protein phosphatase 2C domain-containing protein [Pyrinomonadaceae bacterium]